MTSCLQVSHAYRINALMNNDNSNSYKGPPSVLTPPSTRAPRSDCPVGRALDVLGDRWTFVDHSRHARTWEKTYKEFQEEQERIPTNTLASRLKLLEETGVIEKSLYQSNPNRYEYHLTEHGVKLRHVLAALRDWSIDVGE